MRQVTNAELPFLIEQSSTIPKSTPVSYEISRLVKKLNEKFEDYNKKAEAILRDHAKVNGEGELIVKFDVQATIEKAKKEGVELQPSWNGYEIEEGKEASFKKKMNELGNRKLKLGIKPIDVTSKNIYKKDKKVPLIECLSEYFDVGHILFLEEIGFFSNLD